MKTFTTLFVLSIALVLFSFVKPSEDESIYSSKYLKYSVERQGSTAEVTLQLTNIDQYDELYLKRSDNPSEGFRQVRYLKSTEISQLAKERKIVDKYPLPGSSDTYYKLTAIDKDGIYKLFPCVKLSKH